MDSVKRGEEFLAHHGIKGQRWGVRNKKSSKTHNEAKFVNELGNTIHMSVTKDERGVTVVASGPTSLTEHTWTPMEATKLKSLLGKA